MAKFKVTATVTISLIRAAVAAFDVNGYRGEQ